MPVSVVTALPAPSVAARLERALRDAVRRWDGETFLRVEVPVDVVEPLGWLRAQPTGDASYWRGRSEPIARAGWGVAARVDGGLDALPVIQALADRLPRASRMTLSGRFAPDVPAAGEWAAFGAIRATLPRLELLVDERRARLALHLAPGDTEGMALRAARGLRWPGDRLPDLPEAVGRTDVPGRAGWDAALDAAFDAFRTGALDKVVLARRAQLAFDAPLDPYALLARLEAATPRCFHALVAPAGGPAFVSATPERLFRVDGRELRTEAVAGTRPRAVGDADDDRLLDELLDSDKDQREHAFVRDAIAERLAPLCDEVQVDGAASAMTLARKRHLRTGFHGHLSARARATDVLRALHPTPAVGGTPRAAAADAIERLEPFDRGLYAGPLGWIGPDAAEVAVAIRSGLVDGRALSLYSGAGIVEGSDPQAEWDEIEHKIGDFARVLRLGGVAQAA